MSQHSDEGEESTKLPDISQIIFRSPESKDKYFQVSNEDEDYFENLVDFFDITTQAFIEKAKENNRKIN